MEDTLEFYQKQLEVMPKNVFPKNVFVLSSVVSILADIVFMLMLNLAYILPLATIIFTAAKGITYLRRKHDYGYGVIVLLWSFLFTVIQMPAIAQAMLSQ